jgi:hypothetical protein
VLVSPSPAQQNKSFLRRFFSKKRLLSCSHLNLSCFAQSHDRDGPRFAGLKQFRAMATRYRKTAGNLLVALYLAAIIRLN